MIVVQPLDSGLYTGFKVIQCAPFRFSSVLHKFESFLATGMGMFAKTGDKYYDTLPVIGFTKIALDSKFNAGAS